jgi:hypothetical protein
MDQRIHNGFRVVFPNALLHLCLADPSAAHGFKHALLIEFVVEGHRRSLSTL